MALPPHQPSLKGRVLRLLSAREYSRAELERKLGGQEQAPGELARILDALQANGFINEQRVVDSVVHRRAARHGVARLRYELQQKGLSADVVQQALAGLHASEFQRAREVWRKKFGSADTQGTIGASFNPAERARQMRFLAARGFGADTIRRVVAAGPEDDMPDG